MCVKDNKRIGNFGNSKKCDKETLEPYILSSINKTTNFELIKRASIGIAMASAVDGNLFKLAVAVGTIGLHLDCERRRKINHMDLAMNICKNCKKL